jgi:hypothetical protein
MPIHKAVVPEFATDSEPDSANENELVPKHDTLGSQQRMLTCKERDTATKKLRLFREEMCAALGYKRIFAPIPPALLLSDRSIEVLLAVLAYPVTEEKVVAVLIRHKIPTHSSIRHNAAQIATIIMSYALPRVLPNRARKELPTRESTSQIWTDETQPSGSTNSTSHQDYSTPEASEHGGAPNANGNKTKYGRSPTTTTRETANVPRKRSRPSKADIATYQKDS